MRAAIQRLLGADAQLPTHDELVTMTLQLRGHIVLLIPEIEDWARALPTSETVREAAMAGVGEAQRILSATPNPGLVSEVKCAQSLARSVKALLTQLDSLEAGR